MAAGIFCAAGLTAHADTITTGTTITTDLNGGNPYSGNGIPYDGNSTVTTISGITGANGGAPDTVTLALAATAHGSSNPTPGNPSYGVYTVNTGVDGTGRSLWNYDFYVSSALGNLGNYNFSLTETGPNGSIEYNPLAITDNGGTTGSNEGNSESLDFALFGIPDGYNPNTAGIYTFTLDVSLPGATPLGGTTITVADGVPAPVPDSAPTLTLLGASVAGLICFKRAKAAKNSVSELLS